MKNYLLPLLLCIFYFAAPAQSPERYSSVRISLLGKSMEALVGAGVETEHGQYYPGRSITLVLSTRELERVQNAGFQTEILIDDLTQYYLDQRSQARPVKPRSVDCDQAPEHTYNYATPSNYSYGTMGGYLTYDQMMAELDKMRSLFPNLISARQVTSDTILTWEGRPIYNVKISDNPDVDEAEREVLYTALHHAREPNSASQLIFYMWYLLENYATRDDIKAIVDNLEMYFVPCINVDGYIYNETTNPNGGGYWRKNRRDNGDGFFGIDLNRNYGYFWGDFGGSSPDTYSEIYRGPEAFSEPETRTIRDFCRAHEFLFVLNYHTSGNLFIYPWAYNETPADTAFITYAQHFTRENNYHYGTPTQTVGYTVNGSSDDWMYAEKGAYSFTPEIGTTGFWPQPDEIDNLNKENLLQNLSVAYAALRYGETKDVSSESINSTNGTVAVEFTRYGLLDGPIDVTLAPLTSNITWVSSPISFDLDNLAKASHLFLFQLDQSIQEGDAVIFLLKTNYGIWEKVDTLRKFYGGNIGGATTVTFQDNLNNAANWSGPWMVTGETYHSASTCLTDSPNSNYQPDVSSTAHMLAVSSIPANATSATLRFYAKWAIEEDWDYVQVVGLGQNGFEKALCGQYTEYGVNTQLEGPIFDGTQNQWVEEVMDLADFIGQTVQINFNLGADGAIEADGFYLDDLRIEYTLPTSGTQTIGLSAFQLLQNEPNPASGSTIIRWKSPSNSIGEQANLLIFNALGEIVADQPVNLQTEKSAAIDTRHLSPGIYTYLLRSSQGQSQVMKMTVTR